MNTSPPHDYEGFSYEDLCADIEEKVVQRLKDERREKVAQQLEELKEALSHEHCEQLGEQERWMKLSLHLQNCLEEAEADLGNQNLWPSH